MKMIWATTITADQGIFRSFVQQKMKHTAFNCIFMHNIIFSIRNVLAIVSRFFFFFVCFSFSLFTIYLSSMHFLRRSSPPAAHLNYVCYLHSIVILPFIYFSHWMECSIPNDTTKELYYLCTVHTVQTAVATLNSTTVAFAVALTPFILFFSFHFGFISATFLVFFHFALCHC